MNISFSVNSKSQSKRLKRPTTASFSDAADTDSSSISYVSEFRADEAPLPPDSKIKTIEPLPNAWRPNKKLKNLPALSQSNDADSGPLFELHTDSNPEVADSSMGFGLNLRQPSTATGSNVSTRESFAAELELRKLREDLEKLPEVPRFDEFDEVPVEGFGAAILSGYGWKEGRGIGLNAKEDVKVSEIIRKAGREGLGFTGELPGSNNNPNGSNPGDEPGKANARLLEKDGDREGKIGKDKIGKEVRIVNGREMGMKGKIVEVRDGGDILVLRLSKSNEKVKIRTKDVAELGSPEEEKCLRKLKEKDRRERGKSERVNWLRNHIRVRIISQELKGGRLFLKKGVVVDVVGPGVCDISIDQSNELVQGVEQKLLETALPKRGGPVLVLLGRHKGVFGSLLERDSDKEMGVVRDADTHELLKVKLEEIAEYTGDPSDIGY